MPDALLVAFATRYGSTKEAADTLVDRLCELGTDAVSIPATDVHSLDSYAAVVLATPFYIGSMLKDARRFAERHRAALETKPLALMAFGPIAEEDMAESRKQFDAMHTKMPWFRPNVAEMFLGKYDPTLLRGFDKLIATLPASPYHGMPAQDKRDWDAIKAWATALPARLRLQI